MCLNNIVLTVFFWTLVINNVFVSSDDDEPTGDREDKEETTEPPPIDSHSFVALIDILFTDGTKRTCTGTIIHDHAVITAAHCFLTHGPGFADVEMSGSFVVLGTKKMFDTGYENYLPIERIITHPRYRGWTANLALVFTFAGMTTDKPGNVIPLIGENSSTPVDSNVTILSWGRCLTDDESVTRWPIEKDKRKCDSSEENNDSCERATRKPHKAGRTGSEEPNQSNNEQESLRHHTFRGDKKDSLTAVKMIDQDSANATTQHSQEEVAQNMHKPPKISELIESKETKQFKGPKPRRDFEFTFKPGGESRYLRSADENKNNNLTKPLKLRHENLKANENAPIINVKNQTTSPKKYKLGHRKSGSNITLDAGDPLKSFYKDWRRKAHSQNPKENKLTIESFGFVNVQTCKKIVDKAMPREFAINSNEVVCYAAEEHYISDDDSGAPAVRQGQLVAVTVGGAQCDGDHVAIGMRMNCFCSWIVENLP
ncbi:hypothetical protein PYW08_015989 [Mythimna loreyi]|uniref:Uncharacterized protein n=1 Tax=Mythimna loreyi TaxID=667449 RepID=A0ACC2QST4_9NEOP|nr:hypothetical protein PYW08_015989 [Mythimna loreyi]